MIHCLVTDSNVSFGWWAAANRRVQETFSSSLLLDYLTPPTVFAAAEDGTMWNIQIKAEEVCVSLLVFNF